MADDVTQADRDAANTFWEAQAKRIMAGDPTLGEKDGDDNALIQLLAAHRQSTISRLSEPDDEMIEKGMQAMSEVPLVAGSPDLYEMFRAALSAAAKVMEG